MEDAYALVVLTLLQLCRGEISKPEWYAANLINDPGYTPKPITEIFTSDSTSKNPALFTQPPAPVTTTPPTTITIQNENLPTGQTQTQGPLLITGETIPQGPETSQVIGDLPKTELPSFVIIFDPKRQMNTNIQPLFASLPTASATPPTTITPQLTDTTFTQEPTSTSIPAAQDPSQYRAGNPQQIQSDAAAPFWPQGPMFVYPIQIPNFDPNASAPTAPTTSSTTTPQPAKPGKPLITLRLKSPKGSITNIRINPTAQPTTTRRRNPTRSNNYEICLSSCNGTKAPICSSPMGVYPIDSDRLKGFASLCHMACHNSFRREQVYEKVSDGRCGRLRTRVRPVDKHKLNRDELTRAQYTVVHGGPETVVQFSPLAR